MRKGFICPSARADFREKKPHKGQQQIVENENVSHFQGWHFLSAFSALFGHVHLTGRLASVASPTVRFATRRVRGNNSGCATTRTIFPEKHLQSSHAEMPVRRFLVGMGEPRRTRGDRILLTVLSKNPTDH